jgi:hypothetical protein
MTSKQNKTTMSTNNMAKQATGQQDEQQGILAPP